MNNTEYISIRGAREHNLKNVTLDIPKNKLVAFSGVSGSGKSSMAFDTIFAEGQRRYVESLSSYARQFLGQMEKPKYDSIRGLAPAISIDQKSSSKNPRSTVGTITEIYDYLRVFYARLGIQHCMSCAKKVGKGDPESIVQQILTDFAEKKIIILVPIIEGRKGEHRDILSELLVKGYTKARIDGVISEIADATSLAKNKKHSIEALQDRIAVTSDKKTISRLVDSIEAAIKLGKGSLTIVTSDGKEARFSEERSCCGFSYPKLDPPLFSFNSPLGMCPTCSGIGSIFAMDPEKLVTKPELSISEGAIDPWKNYFEDGEARDDSWGIKKIKALSQQLGLRLDTPWNKLSQEEKNLVLRGAGSKALKIKWQGKASQGEFSSKWEGLLPLLMRRYHQTQSEEMRKYYAKYMSNSLCTECKGKRLRPEILSVTVSQKSIHDVASLSVSHALKFFHELHLNQTESTIGKEIVKEITGRLQFLVNVGLSYLTIDRAGPTLSGGEAQRIRLASQIGSELTGVLYILDEPSIGLHQRDNDKLIATLKHLRDIGNSVIVVEHDLETLQSADWIVDFGPGAGVEGGEVVATGTPSVLSKNKASLTGKYLSGKEMIEVPSRRRKISETRDSKSWLQVIGAKENNLKNIDVAIPLGVFTCITGVSGAGKSTLINQILYPFLAKHFFKSDIPIGAFKNITGVENIDKFVNINQSPIGRTPRSNPATFTKVFDHIRDIFALLPESRIRGYTKGRFSFNVKGGRCEACQGDGYVKVEMHFLADVFVPCETCQGSRFNKATLEVLYKDHSIADILNLTVGEAAKLFAPFPKVFRVLSTLCQVGLDYMSLGQSATTLSGGEAQRIKLSRELAKKDTGRTLYILDEPTTGLHFEDIKKLLSVLHTLVDAGNSVIVIEHNLDVIKTADWIIDLGPEGGEKGGEILATGTPEEIIKNRKSQTGKYLKDYL